MDEIIYLNSIVHYGIMKNIIVLGIIMLLFAGCIGSSSSSISQEEIEKLINGTDKKNISVDVLMYHGEECPHCKNMISMLTILNRSYSINLTLKETWHNQDNAKELESVFDRFNVSSDMRGVPVMIFNDKKMIIGEISIKEMIGTIESCGKGETGKCPEGAFYQDPQSGTLVKMN
jgi:glutaredoxin